MQTSYNVVDENGTTILLNFGPDYMAHSDGQEWMLANDNKIYSVEWDEDEQGYLVSGEVDAHRSTLPPK